MKLPFFIVQLWRGLKVIFGVSKFHHKILINGFNRETLYPLDLTDKLSYAYSEIEGVWFKKCFNSLTLSIFIDLLFSSSRINMSG